MDAACLEQPDSETIIVYLEVPRSKVVLLQAYFELYEGLGVVRTLSMKDSLVCVITTASQKEVCLKVLQLLQPSLQFRFAPSPAPEYRSRILGYYSHDSNI